ncbi:MAG: 16S rRNA (uracil(1498)-N(3))-methyltransferase [Burkholderiales bacterium]|nr:16S rRNA (uracil(1498)-N(3))-methyltransferase [Burkholderiales bacterium]
MPTPRFFSPIALADACQIELSAAAARHAAKVLRLRRGDEVVLFDGGKGEYEASIHEVNRDAVLVDVGRFRPIVRASPLKVCLAQGLASGDKMDTILQKAIELGVSRLQPLATQRSIVRLTDERAARRAQHWQNVAIAACEQCGNNEIPEVLPVEDFNEWIPRSAGVRLLLMPSAPQPLTSQLRPVDEVSLLVGPESGFSETEIEAALAAGFTAVRLGPRILRAETAGLAALAAMQAMWGDF